MQPWFETNSGAYCVECFLRAYDADDDGSLAWEERLGLQDVTFLDSIKGITPDEAWDMFQREAEGRTFPTADEWLWRARNDEWLWGRLEQLPDHMSLLLPLLGDRQPEKSYPRYPKPQH